MLFIKEFRASWVTLSRHHHREPSMRPICLLLPTLLLAGCSEAIPPTDTPPVAPIPDAEGFIPITDSRQNAARNLAIFLGDGDASKYWLKDSGDFGVTSAGRGYFYTKKPYRNFTLRLEYRWPNAADLPEEERPNANTGVLVFITGEHKIWPKCLEVQGKWSEIGHIKSNARDVSVAVNDDEEARRKARKPVGEWNAVEIVSKDGALTSYVNGVKIAESEPTELREGPIGFQAERFDVEFRNVRIREE